MTRLPPDSPEAEATAISSSKSRPAALKATNGNMGSSRRRRTVPLAQLQRRQAQVHPTSTQHRPATTAFQSQSRPSNPEALQESPRSGVGAKIDADLYSHHNTSTAAGAGAAVAIGPPAPPCRSACGQGSSWSSPIKSFQLSKPSHMIKIRSEPSLSCGGGRLRRGNPNASSLDYDDEDDVDHEARAEDERMYDLATWRMYHRIMEARRRRQAENASLMGHPDVAAAAPTSQDVERMVRQIKEQAEASYQQRLAIMEDAIAITSTEGEGQHGTAPTDNGPPSPLSSAARSPRGLMRMLGRARQLSIGAEDDTQGLFAMDV